MISGNSSVGKSYTSFTVSPELLQKVVEAVQSGEKKAKTSKEIQSLEIFCLGLRQNISLGRIYIVPPSVCNDRKNFPLALLHGALVRIFGTGGEEISDLIEKRMGVSEFDEYSQADFQSIKEQLFVDPQTEKEACLIVFAPNWMNTREFICFHFTADPEALKNNLRHQVFSAYFNPAFSSAFNALMTNLDTTKVDVTDITPKMSQPFLTSHSLKEYPALEKQAATKRPTILLNSKTADAVTKETLDPQELDVFNALDNALEQSILPKVRDAESASEGGYKAPMDGGVPRVAAPVRYPKYTVNGRIMRDYEDANQYWQVHGGTMVEELDHMTPAYVLQKKPLTSKMDTQKNAHAGKDGKCLGCKESADKCSCKDCHCKSASEENPLAAHETPFTNVGPGTEAAAKQQSLVPAVKESLEQSKKTKEKATEPFGIEIDEQGRPVHKGDNVKEHRAALPKNRGTYKITFDDGDTIVTDFNGTLEEAERYYIDQTFNLGNGENDRLATGVSVEKVASSKTSSPAKNQTNRKQDSSHPETLRVDKNRLSSSYSAAYNGGFVDRHDMPPQEVRDYIIARMGNNSEYSPHALADHQKSIEAGFFGDAFNRRSNEKWGSVTAAQIKADFIAEHIAADFDSGYEVASPRTKKAMADREARLNKFRPKQAVELDIDSIWNEITEDMGPPPLVEVDGSESSSTENSGEQKETKGRPNKKDSSPPKDISKDKPESSADKSDSFDNEEPDFDKNSSWRLESKLADFVNEVYDDVNEDQWMHCDQCQMASINGTPCHEHGCPNMGSRWDYDTQSWIKQRKCFKCGYDVDKDDPCCSEDNEPIFDNYEEEEIDEHEASDETAGAEYVGDNDPKRMASVEKEAEYSTQVENAGNEFSPQGCDQCQMEVINGVLSHENGCPAVLGAKWTPDGFKQVRKCRNCGKTVDKDDPCCESGWEDDMERDRRASAKKEDTADNPANEAGGEGAINVKTNKAITNTRGKELPKADPIGGTIAAVSPELKKKLHPQRVGGSSKWIAIMGFILDEVFTDPEITEMAVTSDGIVMAANSDDIGMNNFIGSEIDLQNNWRRYCEAAGLTPKETVEANKLFRSKILNWRIGLEPEPKKKLPPLGHGTVSAKKADTADNPYNMQNDGESAPENKKVVSKSDTSGPTPDNTKQASIEEDLAQAKSECDSPDSIDADISQPTVSVQEAGKYKMGAKESKCKWCKQPKEMHVNWPARSNYFQCRSEVAPFVGSTFEEDSKVLQMPYDSIDDGMAGRGNTPEVFLDPEEKGLGNQKVTPRSPKRGSVQTDLNEAKSELNYNKSEIADEPEAEDTVNPSHFAATLDNGGSQAPCALCHQPIAEGEIVLYGDGGAEQHQDCRAAASCARQGKAKGASAGDDQPESAPFDFGAGDLADIVLTAEDEQ